jgi:hypothetical protein
MINEYMWKNWWNDNWQEKLKYLEKTSSSATLSTINSTSSDLGLKLGHCNRKPATKSLSYGMAWLRGHKQQLQNEQEMI